MPDESTEIAPEVKKEVGTVISKLKEAGWKVTASLHDPKLFGNWYVDLYRAGISMRIVKDRSPYMVSGPQQEVKAAGLWRAFDNLEEFVGAFLHWEWAVSPQ